MFLYDRERTGRVPHEVRFDHAPKLLWQVSFRQWPVSCAESTPVCDSAGNLYFGSHDGCLYSLTPDGSIRWQWVTDSKIYSSPLISGDKIYVNVSRSHLVCLDLQGRMQWIVDGAAGLKSLSRPVRFLRHVRAYLYYDYEFKKFMKINAWASPNRLQDGRIATVHYGKGLLVVDPDSGAESWSYHPGGTLYHLAGVAIASVSGEDRLFFASQSQGLHVLDSRGRLLWKTQGRPRHNAWANPSVDAEEGAVYYSESFKNKSSVLYKYTWDGQLQWKKQFPFGCRATVGISGADHLIFLGLDGQVYQLAKQDGTMRASRSIASADRGLWTSPALLKNGNVLINTKKNVKQGSLVCLSSSLEKKWEIEYGKALSTPFVDQAGHLYTGTWNGDYFKFCESSHP